MSVPFEVLESLDIVDSSPQVLYLLEWVAKELDLTRVSSQTDLTRWLQGVIEKESKRLGISESEYKKRFKGMIKFFTQPDLGLKSVQEIQEEIAQEILESLKSEEATIRDYEDLLQVLQEYKDVALPPLTPARIKNEFASEIRKLESYRMRIRSHPLYPILLSELRRIKDIITSGRYKLMPRRRRAGLLIRIRSLLRTAEKIRKDVGAPFGIFRRKLEKYRKIIRESLGGVWRGKGKA